MNTSRAFLSLCVFSLVFAGQSPFASAQVGPDAVTGLLRGVEQLAREGPIGSGTLGLGVFTTICNKGDVPIVLDRLPEILHPAMFGNMYRLRTVDGSARFEQIGQSWIKHSFGTSNGDSCGFGCEGGTFAFIPLGVLISYRS